MSTRTSNAATKRYQKAPPKRGDFWQPCIADKATQRKSGCAISGKPGVALRKGFVIEKTGRKANGICGKCSKVLAREAKRAEKTKAVKKVKAATKAVAAKKRGSKVA